MYDPDLLRSFLAVAQSLSFTHAAANLGLGQPTVSQHVRKLELALGRPLFVRDTRSVTLTSDGEAMAGFARSACGVGGRTPFAGRACRDPVRCTSVAPISSVVRLRTSHSAGAQRRCEVRN